MRSCHAESPCGVQQTTSSLGQGRLSQNSCLASTRKKLVGESGVRQNHGRQGNVPTSSQISEAETRPDEIGSRAKKSPPSPWRAASLYLFSGKLRIKTAADDHRRHRHRRDNRLHRRRHHRHLPAWDELR